LLLANHGAGQRRGARLELLDEKSDHTMECNVDLHDDNCSHAAASGKGPSMHSLGSAMHLPGLAMHEPPCSAPSAAPDQSDDNVSATTEPASPGTASSSTATPATLVTPAFSAGTSPVPQPPK
jgi:hypothetical protein